MRAGLLLVTAALAACADDVEHDMIEAAAMTGPEGTVERALVPERDTWRYDDRGVDLGTTWRTASTSAWASGAAPLGYGETYVVTTVSYGSDPANKHPTTYFRHAFDVPDPSKVKKLYLRAMFDDGFVVYLNGKESGRAYMPSGTITFSTLSTGHETGNAYMTFDISAQIPRLRAGANDLAVEVHQASRSSSDLTMDFALIAFVEEDAPPPGDPYEPTVGGVPESSVWKYWNATTAPSAAWRDVGFDDTAWPHGRAWLGYGETYIQTTLPNRPITSYFRHAFTSDGDASALRLRAAFDDGFVAYLNGVEIARAGMPAGPVTPSTLAFFREEDGSVDYLIVLDDRAHLVREGMNVLAVEVHQNASTSSDLVWNAILEVDDDSPWRAVASGTINDLHDVAFLDRYHGWAVGDIGTLLRTTDGGETWTRVETGTTENLRAITFLPQPQGTSIGWIVGDNGTVLETPNGIDNWDLRSVPGVTADLGAVSAVPGEPAEPVAMTVAGIYADVPAGAGYYGKTILTSPWQHVPAGVESTAILATSTEDVWLASFASTETGGAIHHYDPSTGALTERWSFGQHGAYPQIMRTQQTSTGTTLWVCGFTSLHFQGDLKVRSRDGGATWELMPQSSGRPLFDCAFGDAPSQLGVAVGFFGGISMSEDGGESWRTVQAPGFFESFNLYGADVVGDTAWAVGEHGTILKYDATPDAPVPQFTRDAANPVLDRTTSDPSGWDPAGPYNPSVVRMADGSYTMLYYSFNGHAFSDVIGRAVSPDGVAWSSTGPLVGGTEPFVMNAGGTFHMFSNDSDGDHIYKHRTSSDTVTWTTQGALPWDYSDVSIVFDGTKYVAFLAMWDGVRYATSPDLTTWTLATEPVFDPGGWRITLTVLLDEGIYKMWFTHDFRDGNVYYATSPDGVHWTEQGVAMHAAAEGAWDEHVQGPSAMRVGDTIHLWYTGSADTYARIGHATMTSP